MKKLLENWNNFVNEGVKMPQDFRPYVPGDVWARKMAHRYLKGESFKAVFGGTGRQGIGFGRKVQLSDNEAVAIALEVLNVLLHFYDKSQSEIKSDYELGMILADKLMEEVWPTAVEWIENAIEYYRRERKTAMDEEGFLGNRFD